MTLPLLVFIGVLAIVLVPYIMFVTRPEDQSKRKLSKRLKSTAAVKRAQLALVRETERLSSLGPVDRVLNYAGRIVVPTQQLLEQSGLKMSVGTLLLTCGCAALIPFAIISGVTGNFIAALIVGSCTGLVPYLWVRRARAKRLWKFEEQFPEAIDLIVRALRAGHTFATGLSMVADELMDPVGTEFRLLHDRQNFGMPLPEALRSFAERIPLLDAKFFTTAILTQRDAGGNLAEVLENLSSVIRERFKVRRQVRAISAHGRITGWILAGLPPSLALVFLVVTPKHIQTLFNDPWGINVLIAAGVLQIVGTLIIRKIVNIGTESEPLMSSEMILTLVAVFLTVALASGAAVTVALSHFAPGRRRLRTLGTQPTGTLLKEAQSLTPSMTVGARRLARFIPRSPKDMSKLQKRMALAGYHGMTPALVFAASELVTPLLLGGVMLVFGPPGSIRLVLAVFCAFVGYVMPGLVLQRKIEQRKKVIQNGLPDALDLFIVCLEAGSSLDQAILKTSMELDMPYPPLAEELRMITTETRAGKPRLEAFKNFATRCGVDDVRALVAMLVQADRFGTSIAQALRTHADTARTKRRQRAEERAAKIGVKMVFPLVFCLFPAFMVITAGPGVIQLFRFFQSNQQ